LHVFFIFLIIISVDKRTKSITLSGRERQLKEAEKRVNDILKKEEEFLCSPEYIKQTKGVQDYLLHLSEVKEVQYPSYWKHVESPGDLVIREPLDGQSELYKEVEKLVTGTWEAVKAGHGNDATGLKHTKLVVKRIFLIKNRKHFTLYDTLRKQICREAAVNQFPSLNGLQGEWEVKTRKLGMSIFSNVLCCCFFYAQYLGSYKTINTFLIV